jgi:hypothetical protein
MHIPPEIRGKDEKIKKKQKNEQKKMYEQKYTPPETCGKEEKTLGASFRHSPSR